MKIKINAKFRDLNIIGLIFKITERSGSGKGEVLEEIDGDAITGIGRLRRFQPDYLCPGEKVGNVVVILEWQVRGNGEGDDLTGLKGRLMIKMKKTSRETDISDNPVALLQFPAFRMQRLIADRQRNYQAIEAPSFQGKEHNAPGSRWIAPTALCRGCAIK